MIRYVGSFILLLYCCLVFGETRQHDKLWSSAIIIGSLSADNKIKYYLQPRVGLIDDKYKFENSFLFVGVGYRPKSELTFWLMNGYDISKRLNGTLRHLDIIREQINWTLIDGNLLNLASTSRLEERKDSSEYQWSIRFREMLTTRLPFKNWEGHSLVLFDEVFFNMNHPTWISSNTLVEQNRAFIGIGTQITKQTTVDVGYMNQYQFKNIDSNSNVIYLLLNVAA